MSDDDDDDFDWHLSIDRIPFEQENPLNNTLEPSPLPPGGDGQSAIATTVKDGINKSGKRKRKNGELGNNNSRVESQYSRKRLHNAGAGADAAGGSFYGGVEDHDAPLGRSNLTQKEATGKLTNIPISKVVMNNEDVYDRKITETFPRNYKEKIDQLDRVRSGRNDEKDKKNNVDSHQSGNANLKEENNFHQPQHLQGKHGGNNANNILNPSLQHLADQRLLQNLRPTPLHPHMENPRQELVMATNNGLPLMNQTSQQMVPRGMAMAGHPSKISNGLSVPHRNDSRLPQHQQFPVNHTMQNGAHQPINAVMGDQISGLNFRQQQYFSRGMNQTVYLPQILQLQGRFDRQQGSAPANGNNPPQPSPMQLFPGQELTLSDKDGNPRKYRVDFVPITMKSEEAKEYIKQMSGGVFSMPTNGGGGFQDANINRPPH